MRCYLRGQWARSCQCSPWFLVDHQVHRCRSLPSDRLDQCCPSCQGWHLLACLDVTKGERIKPRHLFFQRKDGKWRKRNWKINAVTTQVTRVYLRPLVLSMVVSVEVVKSGQGSGHRNGMASLSVMSELGAKQLQDLCFVLLKKGEPVSRGVSFARTA